MSTTNFWLQRTSHYGPCQGCGVALEEGEPDPCLGWLPGVLGACCGHGDSSISYILFENNMRIGGFTASEKWIPG